jgi:hypothetical protein
MTTDPQEPPMGGSPMIISVQAIAVTFVFSVFASIFFDLYPANI